jgi:hypothetical protein
LHSFDSDSIVKKTKRYRKEEVKNKNIDKDLRGRVNFGESAKDGMIRGG